MFNYFYNEALRKLVLGFGNLFNNIYVGKYDSAGTLLDKNRVPLTYSPKAKFIRRIQEVSTISDAVRTRITLPRLGFEMVGLNYDPTRKANKLRETKKDYPNGTSIFNYAEVPYLVNFGLYAFSRSIDENLQMVEQIISQFTPEFVISMNFNEINRQVNVPIILTSTGISELYEGSFEEPRTITTTFSFMAKSYIYGRERGDFESGITSGITATYIKETDLNGWFNNIEDGVQVSTFGVTGGLGQTSIYGAGNTANYYTDLEVD